MKYTLILSGLILLVIALVSVQSPVGLALAEEGDSSRGSPSMTIVSVDPGDISVYSYEIVNVTVTIKNNGDGEAKNVDIYYYLDSDYQFKRRFDTIVADETTKTIFALSFDEPGDHIIEFIGKDDGSEFDSKQVPLEVLSFTYYVDDDAQEGGDGSRERPFNTIQDALNTSDIGDTIRVFEGTYTEQLFVNQTVTIVGNGSSSTIIDGKGRYDFVMTIRSESVTVTGFTITNTEVGDPFEDNSGINMLANDCRIFNNNFSYHHTGLLIESFSNAVYDNEFYGNGNGVYVDHFQYDESTVSRNNISSNSFLINKEYNSKPFNLYGVYLKRSHNNLIFDNTFEIDIIDPPGEAWGIGLFLYPYKEIQWIF